MSKASDLGLLDVGAKGNQELSYNILQLLNGHGIEPGLSCLCVAIIGIISHLPLEERMDCLGTVVKTLSVLNTITKDLDFEEMGLETTIHH